MNSMKRQKDMKDELPRSVSAQYITGDQWRNNSRKNDETEPKQKQQLVVELTGDGSKVLCCKEQYCLSADQSLNRVQLGPHGLQQARPHCQSPTTRVY